MSNEEQAIERDKQERLDKINETLSQISDEKQREKVKEDLMTLHNSAEYIVLDDSTKQFMSKCKHLYEIDERLEDKIHQICTKCGYGHYLVV